MPVSTRRTPTATDAVETLPSSDLPPLSEIEPAAAEHQTVDRAGEGPTAAAPTQQQVDELTAEVRLLRTKVAAQEVVILDLKRLPAPSSLAREELEDRARALLDTYPDLLELVGSWPASHREYFPTRTGAAKPTTIELALERDRTYRRLLAEKKDGQRAEFTALTDVYVWVYTFANALDSAAKESMCREDYDARFAKLFNGLHDAISLAAKRLSVIQVKTHPEDFDESFAQVLTSNLSQSKISQQLACPEVAELHQQYIKIRRDKTIVLAAKQSAQAKITLKPASSQQTAGEKSNAKRPNRKKPEERTAPQA